MWTQTEQLQLDQWLLSLSNEQYQKFHTNLGVERVLGVKIPDLEKTAKLLVKKQRGEDYLSLIDELLAMQNEWFSRAAYVLLLSYYLNDAYYLEVIKRLEKKILPAYYTEMAAAWLISMGLVKYPDIFEPWLYSAQLSSFVYQKALQKAIESQQISAEKKKIYRKMKKTTDS